MFNKLLLNAPDISSEIVETTEKISIKDAGTTAIFGYLVVFCGLVILMIVLYCTGAYFKSKDAKTALNTEAEKKNTATSVPSPATIEEKTAPGSAGHVKLYDVPDKDAAMIMAIVADKMQKPINELHFISIKEVK